MTGLFLVIVFGLQVFFLAKCAKELQKLNKHFDVPTVHIDDDYSLVEGKTE